MCHEHGADHVCNSDWRDATTKETYGRKNVSCCRRLLLVRGSAVEELKGVLDAESAYVGGTSTNITYEDVGSGQTGAAEAVKITFDPKIVSEEDLLRIFFVAHDPTR